MRYANPSVILEIGTFDGRTTVHLAENAPHAEIFTIDLGTGIIEVPVQDAEILGDVFVGRWIADRQINGIHQLIGDSRTFDYESATGRSAVDFVFVDGDHSCESVAADSNQVFSILAEGGLVIWHDYLTTAGVTEALNDLAQHHPLTHISGTSLVVNRQTG